MNIIPTNKPNEINEIIKPEVKEDLSYLNSMSFFPGGTDNPLKIPFTFRISDSLPFT